MNKTNYYNPLTKTVYTAKMISNMGMPLDTFVLKNINLYPLEYDIPKYDPATEKITPASIVFNEYRHEYYQTFNVEKLSEEEIRINNQNKEEDLFIKLRQCRDIRISTTSWLVERHREESDMNIGTTLTSVQFAELLEYRQALRDITDSEGAPWDGGGEATPWPTVPEFIQNVL